MNKVKHVNNGRNQKIGTLIMSMNDDGLPVFGWSRYNVAKEKDRFSRRTGRFYAELSTASSVLIDVPNNLMCKCEILVQDKHMVREAIIFINDIKDNYGIYPVNVNVYIPSLYTTPIGELVGENQLLKLKYLKLQEDLSKLQKAYDQKNDDYMDKIFSTYNLGNIFS